MSEEHSVMCKILWEIWTKKEPLVLLSSAAFFLVAGQACFAQQRNLESIGVDGQATQVRESKIIWINRSPILVTTTIFTQPSNSSSAVKSLVGAADWKMKITTTVFWVGEQATAQNPVPNDKSAWDGDWLSRYGGYDNPAPGSRANFIPADFLPRQNPFYVALPYNDVENHHTKSEAAQVIPWFRSSFVRDGQSICKGQWVAIRHGHKVCYAQWEDVGPFATDDWQYVFGSERPYSNRNRNAGLDVSPAVRDYLGLAGMDVCDWKFANFDQIPTGPWATFGTNNTFVQLRRRGVTSFTGKTASRE
jgi:hypothetical protein